MSKNVSINPATGKEIAVYDHITDTDLEHRLEQAMAAFERHRQTSFDDRAVRMNRLADLLEDHAKDYATTITEEMGKPIREAEAEVRKCATVCRYYAQNAEGMLNDQIVETDATRSFIAFEPIGPVLAVMPWNFPFWQVFRFAAPALMAGNTGLLKHASNVTGCALTIEKVIADAGFDAGEFQALIVDTSKVDGIIADDRIRASTLTGSEGAGSKVGAATSAEIKPSVLELGGSDPFIVLNDADVDLAARIGVRSRMQNAGQSCIAAKRFIIEEGVYDRFVDRFVHEVGELAVGDPMDYSTRLGPLAREDLRDDVHDQVHRAVDEGAKIETGGAHLAREGFYYAPTVLTNVEPGSVAFAEEIFGPVAAVTRARDAEHAVELANDTSFGLGGAVFTADLDKGEAVARRLDVGNAFVNGMVKSDPRLPFGGAKRSGYGRELAVYGIREFVNIKTVWIG